jgi:hypothetical protein
MSDRAKLYVLPILSAWVYTTAVILLLGLLPVPNAPRHIFSDWDSFIWPIIIFGLIHVLVVLPAVRSATQRSGVVKYVVRYLPGLVVMALSLLLFRVSPKKWFGMPGLIVFVIAGIPTFLMVTIASRTYRVFGSSPAAV